MSRQVKKRHHEPGFGAFIRKARLKKFPSLSARKFASYIGMTASYLSAIELGKVPPPSYAMVILLAEKLDLDKISLEIMAGHLPEGFIPADFYKVFSQNTCEEEEQPYKLLLLHSIMFYELAKYVRKNNLEVVIEDSQSLMKTFAKSGVSGEMRAKAYAIFDENLEEFERVCIDEQIIDDEIGSILQKEQRND